MAGIAFTTTTRLFDIFLEETKKLNSSPANEIVKQSWDRARGNYSLPVYTYPETLLGLGVKEATLVKLYELLIKLKIDVSDPHTSSSELSIIIGYMSKQLLGEDLSSFRRLVDEVVIRPETSYKDIPSRNFDVNIPKKYGDIYTFIHMTRLWEKHLILSNVPISETSKKILEINDQILEALLQKAIPKIWKRLGIAPKSNATIFFRDLKTYAGDVDFYYWGPRPYEITKELSKYLMPLGFKIDHRSTFLIDLIIKTKSGLKNSYLGAYLFSYFFMGKVIQFNGSNFENFYRQDVLPAVSLDIVWPAVFEWLSHNFDIMGNSYKLESNEYPGFKDLSFRSLAGVMMGLSLEHNTPYLLDFDESLIHFQDIISEDERKTLRFAFNYICYIRNIYQLVTERRWEMIYPQVLTEINKRLQNQNEVAVEVFMTDYGAKLERILLRKGKVPKNTSTSQEFDKHRKEADCMVKGIYETVATLYQEIASEN